jgi:hypothetical protein
MPMETRYQKEDLYSRIGHDQDQPDKELVPGIHPHFPTIDEPFEDFISPVHIDIKDDVDDEAMHGRNRHRKKQARANGR